MPKVVFQDLGLIDYKELGTIKKNDLIKSLMLRKTTERKIDKTSTLSYLLFCEHPHVYTLGKSGDENNLLVNEDYLKSRGATL